MPREILTIGHSSHQIERLLKLLSAHRVGAVADVRRYPGSRRNPQFNAGALGPALARAGIAYEPFGAQLGGRRRPRRRSSNAAWRVEAFRGYADYMQGPEFAAGLRRLQEVAAARRTALMCAEADWHRCHRRLIADALLAAGWRVLHIGSGGAIEDHPMTPFAQLSEGRISYPPAQGTLTG